MKWLLVVFIFTMDANGITGAKSVMKAFDSLEECNKAGNSFRQVNKLPDDQKSLSTCIPESAFDEKSNDGNTTN